MIHSRRRFMLMLAGAGLPGRSGARDEEHGAALRFGLTPVFLDNQVAFLDRWRAWLEPRVGHRVTFVRRGTYREIVDALRNRELDFAWICGYPYARHAAELTLMAVPVFRGKPLYRSYLIVPSRDTASRSMLDLRGKVFAFSDPDSNSGYLYPSFLLASTQDQPERYFRRSFFTWAHRSVVEAVARELADGGAVDGYVWETLARLQPQLTARTRVIHKSPEFGFPPLVAHPALARTDYLAMRGALLQMNADAEGRVLLDRLNLDGFIPGNAKLFDGIGRMMTALKNSANAPVS